MTAQASPWLNDFLLSVPGLHRFYSYFHYSNLDLLEASIPERHDLSPPLSIQTLESDMHSKSDTTTVGHLQAT